MRYQVEEEELRKVYEDLKERGYSLRDIEEAIDSRFRNYLYQDISIPEEAMNKLEALYGSKIPKSGFRHNPSSSLPSAREIPQIERNGEFAELTGILLGDGHINENRVTITLEEGEKHLIDDIQSFSQHLFGYKFKVYQVPGHAVKLKLGSVVLTDKLVEHGLHKGDKIENQVGVPKWIFQNKEFVRRCLRGLIDTDGTVIELNDREYKRVQFSNRSHNLLDDFSKLCNLIEVSTRTSYKSDYVAVERKNDVSNFLDMVSPRKLRE